MVSRFNIEQLSSGEKIVTNPNIFSYIITLKS